MKQLTLRLPERGYKRLCRLSETYGASRQALYEVTARIYTAPVNCLTQPGVDATWLLAKRMEGLPQWCDVPRDHRLAVRLSDELCAAAWSACVQHGICQNVAFGTIVMPWPEDADPDAVRWRDYLFPILVRRARGLDALRRARNPEALNYNAGVLTTGRERR